MKSARRRSRELALQGLYTWQLSGESVAGLRAQLGELEDFDKADGEYFLRLLRGVIEQVAELQALLIPALDRKVEELSPVERAVLLIGTFELRNAPEVPYRVIINEAVELAKSYGGAEGHRYVNGVLDKIARSVRPSEARK
jgi:N utilization substance protein B